MKSFLNLLSCIVVVSVFVFSFFYWKNLFYSLIVIMLSLALVLLLIFLMLYKKRNDYSYINSSTKHKMKHMITNKVYSSFVYVYIVEMIEGKDRFIAKIVLSKYINKKYKDNKTIYMKIDNEKVAKELKEICYLNNQEKLYKFEDAFNEIIEYKKDLPLVFMTTYDFALLINENNNYNKLGNQNNILLSIIREKNKSIQYVETLQNVYITSGLLSMSYQKAIDTYLDLISKESE